MSRITAAGLVAAERETDTMTHRFHPTGDDPPDTILYYNCESCSRQADNLLSLDVDRFSRLWDRTVNFELHDEGGYKTVAEKRAGYSLWQMILTAERFFGIPITHFDAWRSNVTPRSYLRGEEI